jgi:uncharacterized protein (TIGR03435 family)
MLRSLVIERFKLKAHRGSKEVPIYAVALANQGSPGPRLTPSQVDCRVDAGGSPPCGVSSHTSGRLIGRGVTMAGLVGALHLHHTSQIRIDRRLVDRTGLSGTFDFALEWTPDPVSAADLPNQGPATRTLPSVLVSNAANFLAALEQQLGLVLVPAFAAEPALIVDEIELPTLD